MIMPTLEEYLQSQGLDADSDPTKVSDAKRAYRLAKKRVQNRQYRKNHARIETFLSHGERDALRADAKAAGMRPGQYLRWLWKSHQAQQNLLPDPAHVQALTYELNRIGNNINQVAFAVNSLQAHPHQGMEAIDNRMAELTTVITEFCTQYRWPTVQEFFTYGADHKESFLEDVRTAYWRFLKD